MDLLSERWEEGNYIFHGKIVVGRNFFFPCTFSSLIVTGTSFLQRCVCLKLRPPRRRSHSPDSGQWVSCWWCPLHSACIVLGCGCRTAPLRNAQPPPGRSSLPATEGTLEVKTRQLNTHSNNPQWCNCHSHVSASHSTGSTSSQKCF